jgi:hypothetical protein
MSFLKCELKRRLPLLLVTAAVIAVSLHGYCERAERARPAPPAGSAAR